MTVRHLREVLNAIGPPVTTTELAEMVWLAGHLPAQGQGEEPWPGSGAAAGAGAADDHGGQEQEEGDQPGPEPADDGRHALFAPSAAQGPGAGATDLLVPTAPMLRHPLRLQRALRPLKRRLPARQRRLLDEDATAAQVADCRHARPWVPVMVAARERWINLALVVDTGPSMSIWQPLADEVREMLLRLGAFRAVRTWSLADLHDTVGIRSAPDGPAMAPGTLIDPTGRQVVVLLSDCSGRHWWEGRCGPAVRMWAERGPTAILQPLPERLWHRTAAPIVPGRAALPRPGAPNTALQFTPHDGRGCPLPGTLPVPVVELSPDWLGDWARLVTASGGGARDTAVSYQSARVVPCEVPLAAERNLPLTQRILRFHAAASPEAAELAAHAAVAVPSLPVMRLIQQKIIPRSRPSDLAEVLLSGLLQPVSGVPGLYDFIPGARAALLETLPRPETLATAEVLRQVADEIQARAGTAAQTFRASIRVAEGAGRQALGGNERPFALVSDEALRILSHTAIPMPGSAPSLPEDRTTDYHSPSRHSASRISGSALGQSQARDDSLSHISVTTTINGRQITLALPLEIPAGLPARPPPPAGLDTEMQAVLDALDPDQARRSPVSHGPIPVVITGPARAGKTRLAVQAARIAAARGWFPGGMLFMDMRGRDQTAPTGPEQALDSLLRLLAVPGELIPDDPGDRARLYAAVLAAYAENGRRILVIIDDVSANQRSEVLLPADGITRIILTSRDSLDLPRARIVRLPAEPPVRPIASREPTALVLTALPVEMAAVLAHLSGARSSDMAGPVRTEADRFAASGGLWWQVVAAELGPGTVDVARAVAELAARFRPDVLIFVGIAGPQRKDLDVGDVVAGTEVVLAEAVGANLARVRTVRLSARLVQLARRVAREEGWTRRLVLPRPGAKAVVGQIVSGETVYAFWEYSVSQRGALDDAFAVDYENFALLEAGEAYAGGEIYVVRGISERRDGSESDAGQRGAADAAAAFAFELLDAYSAQAAAALAGPGSRQPADAGLTTPALTGEAIASSSIVGSAPTRDIKVTFQPPAVPATALAPLPPVPSKLTGRAAELAALAELLDPSRATRHVGSVVTGPPRAGKTALVLAAGHAARENGWFPGGEFFIDLRGYDESPVWPVQALETLLRALGVPAEEIPPGEAARAALYRSVLATMTGPMLLIADNASSEAQVLPLLPGAGPHKILVTSRRTLAGLGASLLDLAISYKAGHAFLSYAREDAAAVDRLQQALEECGAPVWRDTHSLQPAENWQAAIRQAITDDALVFLACFSSRSLARTKGYHLEELSLALHEMRTRQPGTPWLIPVRFDDCDIPGFDLGGGRTLASLQSADLFGERYEQNLASLVTAVQRILPAAPAPETAAPAHELAGAISGLDRPHPEPSGQQTVTASDEPEQPDAPYFFLSYARTPRLQDDPGDPDEWIAALFEDLCRHVAQLTSERSTAVGFMDRELQPGAEWPGRLADALSSCRVFVPLCSPRYFESEACGKEWFAFTRRVHDHAARSGVAPTETIVPALWVPVHPDQLPPAARSIQFDHRSLGTRYSMDGFWGIMKVRRYRDDYEIAVRRLAKHIVQVATQTMLEPESPPDYESLVSAFEDVTYHGEQQQPETTGRSIARLGPGFTGDAATAPAHGRAGTITALDLGHLTYIAEGGFGTVFRVDDFRLPGGSTPLAFKRFTQDPAERARSAQAAVTFREALSPAERAELDRYTAWPRALVENEPGNACGYLMAEVPQEFYARMVGDQSGRMTSRPREMSWLIAREQARRAARLDLPDVSQPDRLALLAQMTYIIAWLHKRGWVFGDLSIQNAVFALGPPRLMLLGCDNAAPLDDTHRLQGSLPFWDPPEGPLGSGSPGQPLQDTVTDVYKLGLAVLRCLTPGSGASTTRDISRLENVLDADGLDLVARALSADRSMRPTARELNSYLRRRADAARQAASGSMSAPTWPAEAALSSLRLGDKISAGWQGDVYRVSDRPGVLFKRYRFPNANAASLRALIGFPSLLDEPDRASLLAQAAWPRTCVTSGAQVAGFLMEEVPARFFGRTATGQKRLRELQYLLYPPKPLWGDITWPDANGRIQIALAIVSLVRLMHEHAIVIGDISMNNLLWSQDGPASIFLTDCDSARKIGQPPVLRQPQTADWDDPHMPAAGPDKDSDRYKVALAVGRILAASHAVRPGDSWTPVQGVPKRIAGPARRCFSDAAGPRNSRPDLDRWEQILSGGPEGESGGDGAATGPEAARGRD